MPWVLSNEKTQRELEQIFQRDGIEFSTAGFCGSMKFLKQEQRDPRYLELYARYVEAQHYDERYLADFGGGVRSFVSLLLGPWAIRCATRYRCGSSVLRSGRHNQVPSLRSTSSSSCPQDRSFREL